MLVVGFALFFFSTKAITFLSDFLTVSTPFYLGM